ncbi:peptidase M23 [Spirochaetia bacterium]|nr:peptidase M23 [Spirochaetia bacterium]
MASVHEYKRIENNIVQGVKVFALWALRQCGRFFRTLFKAITCSYTVVLVPHSERRVYNFHVTIFSLFCGIFIIIGIAGAFFWYGVSSRIPRRVFPEKDSHLEDAQANLDQLRDEVNQLSRTARGFETVLSSTLSTLGANSAAISTRIGYSGELFSAPEAAGGALREVEDVRRLTGYLSAAMEPVREIGTILDSQSDILSDIPSINPLKGGGHITTFFGTSPDDFTGALRMHKGIDLSTYRSGDPVMATADGQVALIASEPWGFGNYIVIKHKHGFYTRYAHLLSFRVTTGEEVKQGQTIGYTGNTGRSTGPHLHYEVHIGSDVVDPYKYLNIRANTAR